MIKIITMCAATLAFLLVVACTTAHAAPVGNPFLKGLKNPQELADKVAASLAQDPSGSSIIDPGRCKQDGSCARPNDYLAMIRQTDPGAVTSVSQLPDFFSGLVAVVAPKGQYWLACLKVEAPGKYTPYLHCLSRTFKRGEKVWMDPKTKRLILASDCTNPIEKPVRQACAEIHFFAYPRNGDTVVRYALIGPQMLDDECFGLKRPGEVEFERLWKDECARSGCDFSGASAFYGQPVQLIGSTAITAPGEYILRVPAALSTSSLRAYAVALCLERGSESSDGVGVRYVHYRLSKPRTFVATVRYSTEDVGRHPNISWTWGETPHRQ